VGYRAGNFYKNFGMRIDHLLVTAPLRHRAVWAKSIARAEWKTGIGSRAASHRHRQPRPSIRRRLVFGRFANCGTRAEAAMSHKADASQK
jgi:hypothetical protein